MDKVREATWEAFVNEKEPNVHISKIPSSCLLKYHIIYTCNTDDDIGIVFETNSSQVVVKECNGAAEKYGRQILPGDRLYQINEECCLTWSYSEVKDAYLIPIYIHIELQV